MLKSIMKLFDDSQDPVRHCKVFKLVGCAHVDGPLCDMRTCTIEVGAVIRPAGVEAFYQGKANETTVHL